MTWREAPFSSSWPRCPKRASTSSRKMTAGECRRAWANTLRTCRSAFSLVLGTNLAGAHAQEGALRLRRHRLHTACSPDLICMCITYLARCIASPDTSTRMVIERIAIHHVSVISFSFSQNTSSLRIGAVQVTSHYEVLFWLTACISLSQPLQL